MAAGLTLFALTLLVNILGLARRRPVALRRRGGDMSAAHTGTQGVASSDTVVWAPTRAAGRPTVRSGPTGFARSMPA